MEAKCPECGLVDMHQLMTRTSRAWWYKCRRCGDIFFVLHEQARTEDADR